MKAPQSLYSAFYGLSCEAQAKALPDMGDGLAAQLVNLSRDPSPWACEVMAANLAGARLAVLHLREALLRDQSPPDAA